MTEKRMIDFYDRIYNKETSFKEETDGRIALEYKVPKYADLFINQFKDYKRLTVLEVGAGNGELTQFILNRKPPFIKDYTATELSTVGVKKIISRGITSLQMNATNLSFKDNSFDIVCSFDTMHHVSSPKKMAQEMLRVTRKHIFLVEANGLCVLRKLYELLPRYKEAGEKSYTPRQYKKFFKTKDLKYMRVKPFLYIIPFTPRLLIRTMIKISETLEHMPVVRWQGSSVLIYGQKSH